MENRMGSSALLVFGTLLWFWEFVAEITFCPWLCEYGLLVVSFPLALVYSAETLNSRNDYVFWAWTIELFLLLFSNSFFKSGPPILCLLIGFSLSVAIYGVAPLCGIIVAASLGFMAAFAWLMHALSFERAKFYVCWCIDFLLILSRLLILLA